MRWRWMILGVTLPMAGCASTTTHENLAAFLKAHEHQVSSTEARLAAGDIFRIASPRVHELDAKTVVVQPEGKVTLRLVGDVRVVGLTTQEVARKLEQLLIPYYRDPSVEIEMVNQPSRVYYVVGQVSGEGPYRYTGRDTLMHALVKASPNEIAWRSKVKVIRPSPEAGSRHEVEVDLDKMVKTGDTRMNLLLEPGDIVYVPPTPLGWVGLRLKEILFPVSPIIRTGQAPAAIADIPDAYDEDGSVTVSGF